jgi:hypothetical protein
MLGLERRRGNRCGSMLRLGAVKVRVAAEEVDRMIFGMADRADG